MLTALSVYRSQTKKVAYHATLAWLTNSYTRNGWNNCTTFDLYFRGARDRASELGYRIEEFWLREPGLTPKRASTILRSRGISGMIVAPQPKAKMRVRLDWSNFSAVALGYTTAWPQLNVVTNHHFHSMAMAVRRVRAHGYRRIGLAVQHVDDGRSNHAWTGAFLALQQTWPFKQRVPLLFMDEVAPTAFPQWLKKHRPDAIISYDNLVGELEALGYQVPRDIGFASYMGSSERENENLAGINENALQTGIAAIDLLVGMLHRGERGVPEIPQCLLVEAGWREGTTLHFNNRQNGRAEPR
jgi:LacI family transcriptional regulator